jgi:hypothetical protein
MVIERDVALAMDEGLELRADVFRPDAGRHPVLLSCGPYGKGLAFQEGYPGQWEAMVREHPEVARGTSNRFQNWEVLTTSTGSTASSRCGPSPSPTKGADTSADHRLRQARQGDGDAEVLDRLRRGRDRRADRAQPAAL